MSVKITKRKTINTLLEKSGSCVNDKYYFLPFWFEKDSDGNFIMHHLEHLPNNLKGDLMSPRFSKENKDYFNEKREYPIKKGNN